MKKYKNCESIIILDFIFLVTSVFVLISVFTKDIPDYEVVQAEKVVDNVYVVLISKKYFKNFEKNQYVYVNSKRKKIEIIEVTKNYYKNYHRILIRYNDNKNILKMSIYKEKKKFIELFIKCWEE